MSTYLENWEPMLKQFNEIEAEAAVREQTFQASGDPFQTIVHYWPVIVAALRLWEGVRNFLGFFRKKPKTAINVPQSIITAGDLLFKPVDNFQK